MKVSFQNNKPATGVIGAVISSSSVKVNDRDVLFSKVIMDGNEEFLFSVKSVNNGDTITYEDADMEGQKGTFPSIWTTDARKAVEGPLATSGPFKEGEEVKVAVKILDCNPRMKGNSQSFYESKYGIVYHYNVVFEHEGKAITATAQSKEQNKNPFNKDETVEAMVSVKSGYVNIKKVAAPFGGKGFGGGGGSKHDAWARVYTAHYNDARRDHDYATAKSMAITAANEVIKKMEV